MSGQGQMGARYEITSPVVPFIGSVNAIIPNNTGNLISAGLSIPVFPSVNVTARYRLWLSSSAAAVGGVNFKLVYPAQVGQSLVAYSGPVGVTSVWTITSAGATNELGPVANQDHSATVAYIEGELIINGFTAAGAIDLQFRNNGGGETYTILKGCNVLAYYFPVGT